MAEMTTNESGAKKGKKKHKGKKMSTRVDLTAMVDLGFLLITFFMLATTFSKPKAMEVNKPAKEDTPPPPDEQQVIKASKTYTILIASNDKAYCYVASDDDSGNISVDSTDFSASGLREKIKERQKIVAQMHGSQDEMFVLIKPLPRSDYRNLVNVLDEMAINGVKKYAIIDEFNFADSSIVLQVGQSFEPAPDVAIGQ
jgi:biopolymer transport protein ExbD